MKTTTTAALTGSALLVFLFSSLATGCEKTTFTALTGPPPTKEASLDESRKSVRISRNVAMAIECQHSSRPCRNLTVSSDDPAVAAVYTVHLDELRTFYADGKVEEIQASVFLVVGKAAGQTRINIHSSNANTHLRVNVLDD